jgi:hypothetical protein
MHKWCKNDNALHTKNIDIGDAMVSNKGVSFKINGGVGYLFVNSVM